MKKGPVNKFVWTKDALEFLLQNYRIRRINDIAKDLGCTRPVIYNKVSYLGLSKRDPSKERPAIIAERFNETMARINANKAVPWPRVTTNMAAALKGRSFGGNTVAAGTKKPRTVRTCWIGDIGEAKSSMG